MRKLSALEWSGLCLATVLVFAGAWMALFPKESVGRRAASDFQGGDESCIMKLSKGECRVYGIISAAVGLGFGALIVYPWKPLK